MLAWLNILTFLWLAGWAFKASALLARGARSSILFVFPVHFAFCGIPLLLDQWVGKPDYERYPAIALAAGDATTCALYGLYVAACPLLWWTLSRASRVAGSRPAGSLVDRIPNRRSLTAMLTLTTLSPLLVLLFVPEPDMYLDYTPFRRDLLEREDAAFFHVLMTYATVASVLAGMILLLQSRRFFRTLFFLTPCLLAAFWLHGKRNIVAVAAALSIYTLWRKGLLRGRRVFVVGGLIGAVFLAYSWIYQTQFRYPETFTATRTAADWYENFRADYGRDHGIKLCLYAELHPAEVQILDYRGQSLMIYATALAPRRFWPDKPASYAYRLTSEARMIPVKETGGALTTSILDEAISNFGWFGLLIGPLAISLVCRTGDSRRDNLVATLTVLMSFFLQTVHLIAVYPFAMLWIALMILTKPAGNRRLAARWAPRRGIGPARRPLQSASKGDHANRNQ